MTNAQFQVSVLSKVGGRERNEDACGYWAGAQSDLACYVLADGAGGHGGGDVASRVAVQAVLDDYARAPQVSRNSVMDLLSRANDSVMSRQRVDTHIADMRSTLVVLEVDSNRRLAHWGHVGDSRLYCFRQGRIEQRTKDHSLLQNMMDAGLASGDSRAGGADRNVLTGSLGGDDCFFPSATELPYQFESGSAFLLCSDGFWSSLDDADMETSLQESDSPQTWLKSMEQSFVERIKPGSDNYSAIALWYGAHPGQDDERTRVIESAAPLLSGA